MVGWVPQEELSHYFAASNVAFHPYDDTVINQTKCSVRLLDLLLAGVPVVASKVGQNAEFIVPNRTGYLVPAGDVSASTEALIRVATNNNLQRRLAKQAVQHVHKLYNWDVLVEKVMGVYGEPRIDA